MCVKTISIKRKVTGMNINAKDAFFYSVPCGKCPECVKAKINSWLFRIDKELERSTNPIFLTLTYADEHLTYGAERPTLVKRDLQLFFKRLRHYYEKKYTKHAPKIKYYAVGEYGKKHQRPHYHIVLLNVPDMQLVEDAWHLGHIYPLPLRSGGVSYVLKYISKPKTITKNSGLLPEFSLMSKVLAITT